MATSFTRGVVVIEGVVFIASVGGRWAFADYPVLGLIAFDIGLFITPGFPISDVLINRDQTGFSRSGQPSRVNTFCRSSIKVVGDAHVNGGRRQAYHLCPDHTGRIRCSQERQLASGLADRYIRQDF
jgi:hypothetical protein